MNALICLGVFGRKEPSNLPGIDPRIHNLIVEIRLIMSNLGSGRKPRVFRSASTRLNYHDRGPVDEAARPSRLK
jgi:hypothetical protein